MTLRHCEALWLRLLLQDLGYPLRQLIWLYCDNKTTSMYKTCIYYKEKMNKNIIELIMIKFDDQLIYIIIKVVSSLVLLKFWNKLGMYNIYASTWDRVLRFCNFL
jgi:hypothetical protein